MKRHAQALRDAAGFLLPVISRGFNAVSRSPSKPCPFGAPAKPRCSPSPRVPNIAHAVVPLSWLPWSPGTGLRLRAGRRHAPGRVDARQPRQRDAVRLGAKCITIRFRKSHRSRDGPSMLLRGQPPTVRARWLMRGTTSEENSPEGRRTIRATRRRQPTVADAGTLGWDVGPPVRRVDRHRSGSHAGLPHVEAPLLFRGVRVGTLNVHLHHNSTGLSVGATLIVFSSQLKGGLE